VSKRVGGGRAAARLGMVVALVCVFAQPAHAAATFTSAADLPVGDAPQGVAVGDLNGDGKADLAVANRTGTAIVSIRLGVGNGTFTSAADVTPGSSPFWVAVGDLNGDGRLDLAVANMGPNTVSIRLGVGDGTFTSAADVAVGLDPISVAVGDFDGNGKADLVTADQDSNRVSVRLGVGDGTFTSAANVAVGSLPSGVAVGDFNGDDHPDLATSDNGVDALSIRLNQDTTLAAAPTCTIRGVLAGPPKQVVVGAYDRGSGIKTIQVTTQVNVTVRIEPFASLGGFSEVRAVATKTNQSLPAQVAFVVTDAGGRQASCY
jgi:hypothetical protein